MRTQILYESTTELVEVTFSRRPSSCTVDIYDAGGAAITEGAAATLGETKTLTADAGSGETDRRSVTLGDVSGLAFLRNYLLINSAGQREFATLLSAPSSGVCALAAELEYAYASGDTFEEPVARYTLGAVESDETANIGIALRARFTATMPDGSVETRDVLFDVVYHRLEQPVTAESLGDYDPVLVEQLPAAVRGTRWAKPLEKSWEAVYNDLVSRGLQPSKMLDESRLPLVHYYRFLQWLVESPSHRSGVEEYPFQSAKYYAGKYNELLADVVARPGWYDDDDDKVPDADEDTTWRGRLL